MKLPPYFQAMTTGSAPIPPPASNASTAYSTQQVTVILTVILLIFFLLGLFSIYFCRCFLENLLNSWRFRHSPSGSPVGPAIGAGLGLDKSILEMFPTFAYSSVKDLRDDKYGLECAVCLGEFEPESIIRLITLCCHVFHQECIDLWLESPKTCPVCRRSLEMQEDSQEDSPAPPVESAMRGIDENELLEDACSIIIKDDDDDEDDNNEVEDKRSREINGDIEDHVEGEGKKTEEEGEGEEGGRFSRSHSTGHSIVRSRGDDDKFTLRLPEHVKAKLVRGRNWTKSCTLFGQYQAKTPTANGGFGEISGVSGKDIDKL